MSSMAALPLPERFDAFHFPAVRPGGDRRGVFCAGDLLRSKPEQGETQSNQDEPSPPKTEDSD
jgi:hypothetical protein